MRSYKRSSEAELAEVERTHAHSQLSREPLSWTGKDPFLEHQVFDETSNRIVRKGGYDRRVHPKTTPEAAGDVVFASALPCAKMTRRGGTLVARVESQHDCTKADQVPHAAALRFDVQFRHDLTKGF